jgi:putative membrane protein
MSMSRAIRFLLTLACVMTMLPSCSALQSEAQVSPVDQQFMLIAASVGTAEIDLAQLALRQSSSPEVRQFAQHMIDDHTRINGELTQLAKSKKVVLLKAMDPANRTLYSELSKLSGTAFDRQYSLAQLNIHLMGNALYQSEAQYGQDPDTRQFAAKNFPTGVDHFKMAQPLGQ